MGSKLEEQKPDPEKDDVSIDGPAGVRAIQAATSVWTKWHLMAAYGLIWLIYCIIAIQEAVVRSLTPYVTSVFQRHSLTATTGIMSSLIGGLIQIPLAKILDTWGRPQGLALVLFFWVVGFIMMACCNNVETYAAAQVFSDVGSSGVSYTLTVFVSDTSSLRNRALMLSFATSPYIALTWAGGPISQSALKNLSWRWGFGIFAIVIPVVVLPLCALLWWNQRKARKAGLDTGKVTDLSWKSIKQYCISVDLLGIIILAGGMALLLLPFSIYSYQGDGWRSPIIYLMITFGGLLLITFVLYERYLAPSTFIPYNLLLDRTVFSAGIMFVFYFFNGSVWGSYFGSMLQVVWNVNVENTSYITSIRRVAQCLWGIAVGYFIHRTGRFKWVALVMGIPLQMLANGLMIHLRTSASDVGLVAMAQIFAGFAGAATVLTGELAMMTPSGHQHIAVIIATLNLFCSIGSAAGGTVAAAIWTGVFPERLARYLPDGTDAAAIYADLNTQLSYPVGSPERLAIDHSYADAQRLMLAASLGLCGGGLICVLLWRNLKVTNYKQTKGRVA
ncbi:hypothetical protein N3K66_009029 [Trichothecium roseum]|uniref:Uncharacterized protein n=1 Tax=Trichothecium roseum TaxID=47278 RepID=A0ACC0URJ6_9HYPO|nr:hypothetical protein N3K66_009029 [Trichothecium roseum]